MNQNFLKTMYPSFPSENTHYINSDIAVLPTDFDSQPPAGNIITFNEFLDKNTEFILLEYGIGFEAKWSRIKIDDKFYFIENKFIISKKETIDKYQGIESINQKRYNFENRIGSSTRDIYKDNSCFPFSTSSKLIADSLKAKKDWKSEKVNVPYFDNYRGLYCVHYESLMVTSVTSDQDIKEKIKEACYAGASLILKSRGLKYDFDYVRELVDNFYFFCTAEEWYFPPRPCSTLRVLVSIPKRFIHATDVDDRSVFEANLESTFPEINFPEEPPFDIGFEMDGESTLEQPDNTQAPAEPSEEDAYTKLIYNSKNELDIHFATIGLNLVYYFGLFNLPPGIIWSIKPELPNTIWGLGYLNLIEENSKLVDLYTYINYFLHTNIRRYVETKEDFDIYKKIYKVNYQKEDQENQKHKMLSFTTGLDYIETPEFSGRLELYFDKNNLVLKKVKFFYKDENRHSVSSLEEDSLPLLDLDLVEQIKKEINFKYVEIPMTVDTDAFLNDDSVTNKTSLNYLLKINPAEKLKNKVEEKKDLTEFGKILKDILDSLGEILEFTDATLSLNNVGTVANFLTKNHYPTIYSVDAESVDFGACADATGLTLKDRFNNLSSSLDVGRKISQIQKLQKDIEKAPMLEGGLFIKYLFKKDYVQDENFKIIIGEKKLTGTGSQKLRKYMAAANSFDITRWLREALKCSGSKFDPTTFINVVEDFEKLQLLLENPDLLLLCNPLMQNVLNVLKQLANFKLPGVPIYDPNQLLAEQLRELVNNIINELVVMAIRALITGAIKDCTKDNNPDNFVDPNAPAAANKNKEDLNAGLDNAVDSPDIDSFLNDYFNLNNNNGRQQPENIQDLKNAFKQELKNLLDDVVPCLTTRELCYLLTGRTVNDDVYDIIMAIVKRKYNTPWKPYNLADKLNNKNSISVFFEKLGTTYNLEVCENIINNPIIPTKAICDDGRREIRDRILLQNKGLPDDLIDDLLNDIKQKDLKDLKDVLKFLNSETPFDLSDIPTIMCKKGPNGEIIPPLVSLSPPMKSFNSMMDSIYKLVYDSFDSEAPTWYKSSYSVSSSARKNNMELKDGKFVTITSVPDNERPGGSEDDKRKPPTEKIIPSYTFANLLTNGPFTISEQALTSKIDGVLEQYLEMPSLPKDGRDKVLGIRGEIFNFLESFFHLLDNYLLIEQYNSIDNFSDNQFIKGFYESKNFKTFLKIGANIYSARPSTTNNPNKNGILQRVLKYKNIDIANAYHSNFIGLPLEVAFVRILQNNNFETNLRNLISTLKLNGVGQKANTSNKDKSFTYDDPDKLLTKVYNKMIGFIDVNANYNNNKKLFEIYINALNLWPTYDAEIKYNPVSIANSEDGGLKIYNSYNLNIKHNNINIIKNSLESEIDNSVIDFLTGTLFVSKQNIVNSNKQQLFDLFVNKSKERFVDDPNPIYTGSIQKSFVDTNVEIFDDFSFSDQVNALQQGGFLDPSKAANFLLNNDNNLLTPNYSGINKLLSKNSFNGIINSPFLKTSSLGFDGDAGDPNALKPSDNKMPFMNLATNIHYPNTQLFKLFYPQTEAQKACNVRPHYLDIDSTKEEASKAKEKSYCLEEVKNEKALKGESINTNELQDLELSDTQMIMLDGAYRLLIRTYLHDYMLRGISLFGYYDPQSIRKNDILLSFLGDFFENDLRGKNNTLFITMASFYKKAFEAKNKTQMAINNIPFPTTKKIINDIIKDELKEYVLPKLAKRIINDTNKSLGQLKDAINIKLKNPNSFLLDDVNNNILVIDRQSKSVYLRVNGTQFLRPDSLDPSNTVVETLQRFKLNQELGDTVFGALGYKEQQIYYQKIYKLDSDTTPSTEELFNKFAESPEYKFLFNFIFPLENNVVFMLINAILSASVKKDVRDSFKATKSTLDVIIKNMLTNGNSITPDLNNSQDVQNNAMMDMFIKFIIDSLIKAPISIVKGFTELTEPNIAISSKTYMLAKTIVPQTPSFIIPSISLLLGLPIFTPPMGIVPWINLPLAMFYLAGGLWYEEGDIVDIAQDKVEKLINDIVESKEMDCSMVINPDKIYKKVLTDGEYGYDVNNPDPPQPQINIIATVE